MGKTSKYNFNSATLIFIAREGEQISWISNYIFHLLSTDFVNTFLNLRIFITLKKNNETVPSFLFWRAIMLTYRKNLNIKLNFMDDKFHHEEEKKGEEDEQDHQPDHEKERLQTLTLDNSPVYIKFGRPNFDKIFRKIAAKGDKYYDVFTWVPEILSNHLHYVLHYIKKDTGVTFKLTRESFT
jgi:hypothetical protein